MSESAFRNTRSTSNSRHGSINPCFHDSTLRHFPQANPHLLDNCSADARNSGLMPLKVASDKIQHLRGVDSMSFGYFLAAKNDNGERAMARSGIAAVGRLCPNRERQIRAPGIAVWLCYVPDRKVLWTCKISLIQHGYRREGQGEWS